MRRFFAILFSALAIATTAFAVNGAPTGTDNGSHLETYKQIWNTVNARYLGDRSPEWAKTEHKFDGGITSGATLDAALVEALKTLGNAKLRVLNLDEVEAYKSRAAAGYIGVGLSVDSYPVINGGILISKVEVDSPAEAVGLLSGDRIVAVDGKLVQGETLSAATERMRGEDGTSVKLTIERAGRINDIVVPRDLDGTLGVSVENDHALNLFKVRYVYSDGPAAKAGLKENDVLFEVDNATVSAMTEDQLLKLIGRGHIGSVVSLKFERDGVAQTISITRDIVKSWDNALEMRQMSGGVRASGKDDSYSHLWLKNLDWQDANTMVDAFIPEFMRVPGAILDLRGASGDDALLAARVTARFMTKDGTILAVKEMENGKEVLVTYEFSQGTLLKKSPAGNTAIETIETSYKDRLVVLVDGNTAGGAAAIAHALQHNGRARVVGWNTSDRAALTETFVFGERGVTVPSGKLQSLDGGDFKVVTPDRRVTVEGSAIEAARAELAGEPWFENSNVFVYGFVAIFATIFLGIMWLVARRDRRKAAERVAAGLPAKEEDDTADGAEAAQDDTPAPARKRTWSDYLVLLLPFLLIGFMFAMPAVLDKMVFGPPAGSTSTLVIEVYTDGEAAAQRQVAVIEELKAQYKGDIEFRTTDVRQNPDVLKSYDGKDWGKVEHLPSVRIVKVLKDKDGKELKKSWQMGGRYTKRHLVQTIDYWSKSDRGWPSMHIERHKP